MKLPGFLECVWVGVCCTGSYPFSSYIIIHNSAECSRDIDKTMVKSILTTSKGSRAKEM